MDKELAQLQKEVIKRLIEYEDQLQALGDTNQLKKTKRVSSSVAINIAAFPDLIQNLLDSGVETKKIVKELRNFQEGLLRDTVTIKGTETAHHQGMLRTGGSFYRADPEIWQGSVAKLADFFGTQFGDVPENIRSYINWAHKSDTNTKGIEKALLGPVANPDPSLTAHPFGTVARSLTKDLSPEELSDPDKFFDAMAKRIDAQLEAVKVADQVSRPLVETIQQNIDPRAYRAPDIPTNIEIQKKVLLPENRQIVEKGILEVVKGSATLNRNMLSNRLTRLALPSVGGAALSLTLGAQDLQAREAAVAEDPSFINKLQRDLTKTEMAADVVGAVPSPATPAAEITGLGAGLTNLAIDVARDPMEALQTIGGGIKYLADEYILGVPAR
tara:strand:- start:608 stop:1765 length:1158 start_codon:yes stop_codon:yes gene_type:complete